MPAAPVYVGGNSASGNSAAYDIALTGLTGGIDTEAREGDFVIVVTGFYSVSDLDPGVSTSGFFEESDLYSDDTRDANGAFCWKFMTSSPDAVVSCNGSGNAANGAASVCHVWRGVDPSTPMDVALVPSSGIDEARVNTTAITPTTVNSQVISCGIGVSAASQGALGAPTGYTNYFQSTVDPGMAATAVIASKVWAAGAENPGIFTGTWSTSTSDSWVGFTAALRPAPDATTALTGTVTASITETDIVTGGKTIILTVTNDSWAAAESKNPAKKTLLEKAKNLIKK